MNPAVPVSPPDIAAILTSLGIFSLAIAAVVGGIYRGISEVKKGTIDGDKEVKSAMILETVTAKALSDSQLQLTAANKELLDLLRTLVRAVDRNTEAVQDYRETSRSAIEEQHRLRAGVVDLVEQMRRR